MYQKAYRDGGGSQQLASCNRTMRRYLAFRYNLDRRVAGTTFGAGNRVSRRHEVGKELIRRVHTLEIWKELVEFTQSENVSVL